MNNFTFSAWMEINDIEVEVEAFPGTPDTLLEPGENPNLIIRRVDWRGINLLTVLSENEIGELITSAEAHYDPYGK